MQLNLTELDEKEILRYLGCRGKADAATLALVRECAPRMLEAVYPRAVFGTFSFSREASGIRLSSGLLLGGNDLMQHLKGCSQVVLMAATLSAQADALIRAAESTDMAKALVLDACATAAIEQVCDLVGEAVQIQFPQSRCSSRFSPGYGDLPIQLQNDLLTLLDTPRKIGLCATANHLLTPRKSVTAFIGIRNSRTAAEVNKENACGAGCNTCSHFNDCQYRRDEV